MIEETGDILSPRAAVLLGPLAGAALFCWVVPVDITVVAFPMDDEKADDESLAEEEGTEEMDEEQPPPPNTEEQDVPPGDEDLDLQLKHDKFL